MFSIPVECLTSPRSLLRGQKLRRVAKLKCVCNGSGNTFLCAAVLTMANCGRANGTESVFGFPLITMLMWKLLTVTHSNLLVVCGRWRTLLTNNILLALSESRTEVRLLVRRIVGLEAM